MKLLKRFRLRQYVGRNIAACEIATLLFYKLPKIPGKTKEQMASNYIGWLHDIVVDPKWMDYL